MRKIKIWEDKEFKYIRIIKNKGLNVIKNKIMRKQRLSA